MDNHQCFARTVEGSPDSALWQPLHEHLENVARMAAEFAGAFASSAWGNLAGLWHDLGKYQDSFQDKLQGLAANVEHSGVGASVCFQKDKNNLLPLAFVIAAHHGELPNLQTAFSGGPKPLIERLKTNQKILELLTPRFPESIREAAIPKPPHWLANDINDQQLENLDIIRRRMEFWTRFLFSALVDADRLDAEAFCDPEQAALRSRFDALQQIKERFDKYMSQLRSSLTKEQAASEINTIRESILLACIDAAEYDPGAFTLTVPTGGGKTLSSMAFALNHAVRHGLRRVIVVIPFTSIIEQNAAVYRKALGNQNVIEHHSGFDIESRKKQDGDEFLPKHEQACENWDAPVIVTTNVQFLETLFSSRATPCRKLHNIARSIVIMDEVQTLPPNMLHAITDGLNELVSHYGCSIVLSTATPPALRRVQTNRPGLDHVREIIEEPGALAARLQRVSFHWPDLDAPPASWADLAIELNQHDQALAVVHRRADARDLAVELKNLNPDVPVYHLSALMCGAHRSRVLDTVREKLKAGAPCRLVSTQLVEAGVDVDFPVVYRALGGLDSIVQAAGRCNREGRLKRGHVFLFQAPTTPPRGTPKKALAITRVMLKAGRGALDPSSPETCMEYFKRLYSVESLDSKRIQTERAQLNFATVGRTFKIIEDGFTTPLVVPWGQAEERLHSLHDKGPSIQSFRALQPFVVNVFNSRFDALLHAGALQEIHGVYFLILPFKHFYDPVFGLTAGDDVTPNPESLIT